MKILISPAKSLDYTTAVPVDKTTKPSFVKESKVVNEVLQSKTPMDLEDLMKISNNLAELNWKRNQERSYVKKVGKEKDFRQAVFAFNGDVYTGLDAYSLTPEKIEVLQDKLRILSGLYGLLKPLDEIEPYRLEMGTKMRVGENANLYEFWKPILADALNKEMKQDELLINLASNEYFSAIDKKVIKGTLVTPDFKELRDGKLKTISFYAKKARGLMVRYIIDNNVTDIDGLKKFNVDGYAWSEADSKGNNLVFTR
ncbi:peroxide stress protein YaaA [Myroides marinus]|uniref:peroxide stress protein YaaA n=1 Tax=Myroides marinus TaxID=703342 RepID=UPI0025750196|nr:peroxide stress protein YaaA [Myroides marinus]MDM1350102.1 peroxide stress protein YaaA [Myroides marinus]MDM1357279.1 peroxide stress protein YaaA [Myroides marinus]MDM1501537.1 peroxide stress protein YaaA [Myroides marinus]